MVLNPECTYPSRYAYVLKLRRGARPEALAGRIENLVTGNQLEFEMAHELLQFLTRDLDAAAGEMAVDTDDPDPDVDRIATGC